MKKEAKVGGVQYKQSRYCHQVLTVGSFLAPASCKISEHEKCAAVRESPLK